MVTTRIWRAARLVGAAATLGGCVATPLLSVVPGQGKSYADLQRDDAACRAAPVAATTAPATATATTSPAYYQCMAARGELVVANRTAAYPAYAATPYYPYAYPAYGYPYYGYPYSAAYLAPYVGLGIGLGFGGGFYGGRYWHRGFEHHGFGHGHFRGGWHGHRH